MLLDPDDTTHVNRPESSEDQARYLKVLTALRHNVNDGLSQNDGYNQDDDFYSNELVSIGGGNNPLPNLLDDH